MWWVPQVSSAWLQPWINPVAVKKKRAGMSLPALQVQEMKRRNRSVVCGGKKLASGPTFEMKIVRLRISTTAFSEAQERWKNRE